MSSRLLRVDVERVLVEGAAETVDPAALEARLPEAIGRELSVELPGDASPDRIAEAVEAAIGRAVTGESTR
jgi:hypothetical protein